MQVLFLCCRESTWDDDGYTQRDKKKLKYEIVKFAELEKVIHKRENPRDLAVLTQHAEISEESQNWEQAKARWEKVLKAHSLLAKSLPKGQRND